MGSIRSVVVVAALTLAMVGFGVAAWAVLGSTGAGDVPGWQSRLGTGLTTAALVLVIVGGIRGRASGVDKEADRRFRRLGRAQRRSAVRQVRGRDPVTDTELDSLRELARLRLQQRELTLTASGLALLLSGGAALSGETFPVVLMAALTCLVLGTLALLIHDVRTAAVFLRHYDS